MSSDEEIWQAAREVLQVHGHVDVLVNNAGTGTFESVEELK